MKTKSIIFTVLICFLVSFSSCASKGKTNNEMKVSLQDTTIRGGLSEYFSVVDHEYTYQEGIIDKVKIELRCLKQIPEDIDFYFGIEVYDDSGMPISIEEPSYNCYSDQSTLSQLREGETTWIEIENYEGFDSKEKIATKIKITSVIKPKESSSYVIEEVESETSDDLGSSDDEASSFDQDELDNYSSTSSKSVDYDEILDKYERFVNKYVALAKKYSYNSQKIVASSEYLDLLSNMQEYVDLCNNAKGTMSASQWSRFSKIAIRANEASQKILENQN